MSTTPLGTTDNVHFEATEPGTLKKSMHRAEKGRRAITWLLLAPLLIYTSVFFVLPLCTMLYKAVDNPEVISGAPNTSKLLSTWQSKSTPLPDAAYSALVSDLKHAYGKPELGELARRLNYEISGFRSLIMKSARKLPALKLGSNDAKQLLYDIDNRWQDTRYWIALKRSSERFTPYYLLAALDLKVNDKGEIGFVDQEQRVYTKVLIRTLTIATVVTLICLLIGYPLAALMVRAPKPVTIILMLAIMLPFWTSLLARTSAWIVTLQANGIFNNFLISLGIIAEPLELIFNSTGVYIVMVHILLPFAVLPIYNNLQNIPNHLMLASSSLGAHPVKGFISIYLPLSIPGISAGGLLTFIVAVGYYITPSLVGSAGEQMLGYFIAFYTNTTVNWGMASALGIVLLLCVMGLYALASVTLGVKQLAGIK
ncbi:ABC transporter permease [Motiliproteus sp. MSK22-1]|uniref:ABC transporter permease n=1 Tax=Motiliproteus sp. MSK22-1 TaxID=1897630 RepID=UPI0009761A32|nr:ABC transporter permease [Motiliproteus sp. MSK22-1]OMH37966.1 spermidine/putrescine ABC transporter permease [Motiliproteus sp. MSK22-1]